VETGHGRIHERRCRVFYGVDRISGTGKFRGVCAVVEVTTHTTYKATGKETSQTRYYITSMRGSAQLMDYISRKHCGIENNQHWELDTLQGQDATKRKYPKAARNLDTIQKIVHAIIAYTARKKLPDEISSSKEKMKTQFKSLMTMASFNIGFALSMMAL
jgi:predicted transposase YbfD/YdcC